MSISEAAVARSTGPSLGDVASMLAVGAYPRQHAAQRPEKPALICGETVITYADLDLMSRRFARLLAEWGIAPGDRIAYLGRNSDLFFPVMFGCIEAGVVLVPLNWRCTAPEIAYMLQDSGSRLLFADADFMDTALRARGALEKPLQLHPIEGEGGLRRMLGDGEAGAAAPATFDLDAVIFQMYTSGTTGRPKGVLLDHRAWSFARQAELVNPGFASFGGDDVILSPMPNFHVGGLSWVLMGIVRGCTCVLTADPSPDSVLELSERHGVARIFIVPTVIRMLVDGVRARGRGLPKLRAIYYGAAPMGEGLLRDAMATFGCEFGQFYGMTEATGATTFLSPEFHDPARPDRLASVGTAYPGMVLEIRDFAGRLLAPRQPCEIYIHSPTAMVGYWGLPEATAEVLVDGWYRTGDGGYIDEDGFLFLTDRIKDMIVSGGENVYPVEVEEALRRHPAVYDAAVIGVKDDKWGEKVVGVVELRPGQQADAAGIIAETRAWIAGYKLPREIAFVEALPRTASGKIQRGEVRKLFTTPRP